MNTNCQFPLIEYQIGKSNFEWGLFHGEAYRTPIKELAEIRKELMLAKNKSIIKHLDRLALEQFEFTKKFAPRIASEMEGIKVGSNLTLTEIVILNNYTDFRDITLPDEGCSTVHIQTKNHEILTGQTWDMHRSAKNYMSLIHIPKNENHSEQLILTLVGCVGLMGINTERALIGVNNINTTNAKTGLIWPALVRQVIEKNSLSLMRQELLNAPVTSGHNYLISTLEGGEHLEITPTISEKVSSLTKGQVGSIFHTNHCVASEIQKIEDKSSMSSTTFNRWNLLSTKTCDVNSFKDFKNLLINHDEFPKSICSHFENGAQDPSFTCGGGIANLNSGEILFWRGCPTHDNDYKEYAFQIENGQFIKKDN